MRVSSGNFSRMARLSRISNQIVSSATIRIVTSHRIVLKLSIWGLPEYCRTMITTSSGSRNSATESRAST